MAKISISKVLAKRKWTKIGTAFAVLVLGFFIVQLLVIKNPWGAKAATTISSSISIGASTNTYDNQDIIITGSGTVVTIAGQHHFKSLIIQNSAKLTHAALVPVTDFDISTSALTASGQNKKINITVDGDVTLASGGSIDADGKGYPGGWWQWNSTTRNGCNGDTEGDLYGKNGITSRSDTALGTNYGFGPGGGISYQNYDGRSGGGGGFGGAGKLGTSAATGSASYSYNSFQHGSGGGAASHDGGGADTSCADGGNGGGVIILNASSIKFMDITSKISANGTGGYMFQDDGNAVGSGGGSGGLINITTSSFNYSSSISWNVADYSAGINPGSIGQISVTGFDNNALFNLYVIGGDRSSSNRPNDGSGGGGGWIVVQKTAVTPEVTIKKTLIPYKRTGAPTTGCQANYPGEPIANCFNPYALQSGDVIKVVMDIGNPPSAYNLVDEYLHVPSSSYKCSAKYLIDNPADLDGHAPYNNSVTAADGIISWSLSTASGTNFWYYCKVIQP